MERTHVYVISDLHLGGETPCMMSRPERLAAFIDSLPSRLDLHEQLELVIAGDFIDFLAVPPLVSWTADPVEARRKLETTLSGECRPVFAARLLQQALPKGSG